MDVDAAAAEDAALTEHVWHGSFKTGREREVDVAGLDGASVKRQVETGVGAFHFNAH